MPDLIPRWELLLASSREAERRQRPRPYRFSLPGSDLVVEVHDDVYSPLDFYTWRFYLPRLPPVAGLEVLEVGCGAGIAALWMAARGGARRVVAVDILLAAAQCTAHNAHLNGLSAVVEARVSDVFEGLEPEECFDLIFWNVPWGWLPPGFSPARLTPVTVGNFDVGYQAIGRFLRQGPARLRPGGRILMTAGERTARWPLLRALFAEVGYRVREIDRAPPPPPDRDEPLPDTEAICLLELSLPA